VGNSSIDDSPCVDYGLIPGSAFLAALADSLNVLTHNLDAAADFRTAGFYELPHPTLPNEEILVLNSVLWSPRYSNLEYRFSAAYGYDAFTAGNLETLATAIHDNPNVRLDFRRLLCCFSSFTDP
jgi:hypothetical protein